MNLKDIRHLAIEAMGDDYYEEYKVLKSDIDFFNMYIKRNKKSSCFWFKVVPCYVGTYHAFDDIQKAYGIGDSYLEDVYCVFILLKDIIYRIWDESFTYSDEVVADFNEYLHKELGLDILDYVADFVGCSTEITFVKNKITEILSKQKSHCAKGEC